MYRKNRLNSLFGQNFQSLHIRFIRELNGRGKAHQMTWKLIDRGKPFSRISGVCQLCLKEKFYILYKPEMATLNTRNEIFNSCSHKKSKLLIKKPRGRKKVLNTPNKEGAIFIWISSNSVINLCFKKTRLGNHYK